MNYYAIRAIYTFEMARTLRTPLQSFASPVISTILYFIVFGSAIGHRMIPVDGVSYGAFIVPGLIMLTVMTQSIANASFGIYFPKFLGTIYEHLSAPISPIEMVTGYVGAAATKSVVVGLIILGVSFLFVPLEIAHPSLMMGLLMRDRVLLFSAWIYSWALGKKLRAVKFCSDAHHYPISIFRWKFLFHRHVAVDLARREHAEPGHVFNFWIPLGILW
jgi:ABC-2 type transport system permease protein